MKEKKSISMKMAAVLLAACLLIGGTVGGTLAWLVFETDPVKNTFTVGNIEIELSETTSTYKIVPGGTSDKDPKITVKNGSEKCYVYALIENNMKVDSDIVATPNIAVGYGANEWVLVNTNGNRQLYRYNTIADASSADYSVEVFTEVSYSDDITEESIKDLDGETLVVWGYAHQSENLDDINTADAAATAWAALATIPTP